MRTILTLTNFAKKLGYASVSDSEFQDRLRLWKSNGVVKVQQSGYRGHSLAHPKIAILSEDLEGLKKFSIDVSSDTIPQVQYACPYCGRSLSIYDSKRQAWFFAQQLQVLLECSHCTGRFVIRITDPKEIKQLNISAVGRKKAKRSWLDDVKL